LEIYCAGGGTVVNFAMCEEDVRYGMKLPWVATASDGWGAGPSNAPIFHPRMFGTFPRKIGRYVLEDKVLPLAQAIRSCAGLPADILRLANRGYLRADAFADVLAFDPKTFRDQSTVEKPGVYATGVRYLFVNGKAAIEDGNPTQALGGRVLRRGASRRGERPQPNKPANSSEAVPSLRCSLPPQDGLGERSQEEHRRDGTASEKAFLTR